MESGLGEGCQERPSPTHTFGSSQTQGGLFLEAERAPQGASHPTWHMGKPPREAGKGLQGFVSHTAHGASRLGGQRCSVQKGVKVCAHYVGRERPRNKEKGLLCPKSAPTCWPLLANNRAWEQQNSEWGQEFQSPAQCVGQRAQAHPHSSEAGQWGSLHSEHLLSIVGPERLISL